MPKRRSYSSEFELEAIEIAKQPGVTMIQIAKELALNSNMIRRWQNELAVGVPKAPDR